MLLPLCFEKKKEDKKETTKSSRPRLLFRIMNAHFFFILSNAHTYITSSRALSLSLLRYFSRNSSGRKEVVVVVESLNTTFRFYTRSL